MKLRKLMHDRAKQTLKRRSLKTNGGLGNIKRPSGVLTPVKEASGSMSASSSVEGAKSEIKNRKDFKRLNKKFKA